MTARWRNRSSASSAASTLPPWPSEASTSSRVATRIASIHRALVIIEVDVQDDIGARRQLGSHLTFETAQHEWTNALAQACGGAGLAAGDRFPIAIGEVAAATEQPAVDEVHQAPQPPRGGSR